MATKKQRKRQQKDRRHDWEYVYVDGEGQEVEVAEDESNGAAPARRKEPAAKKAAPVRTQGRGGRTVAPPSWRKVFKRALIFAPVMFLAIHFLNSKLTLQAKVTQTVFLLVFFVPFSYFLDSMVYRSYKRRMQAPAKK